MNIEEYKGFINYLIENNYPLDIKLVEVVRILRLYRTIV